MKKILGFFLSIILFLQLSIGNVQAEGISSLQEVATLNLSSTVTSVDYSKDDLFIITGTSDGKVSVWNAKYGKLINSWQTCNCSGPVHVKYSPDNSKIASASANGEIKLWDTATGTLIDTYSTSKNGGPGKPVNDIVFNENGTLLYSANADRNSVTIWDILKDTSEEVSFSTEPKSLAYNPIKTELVVGLANGSVNIRQGKTGNYIREVSNLMEGSSVAQLDFSPNYQYLFGISTKIDQTQPYMLDANKNYEIVKLEKGQFEIQPADSEWLAFSFSKDGQYLAAASSEYNAAYKTLTIFDVASKQLIATVFAGEQPEVVSFSHNDERIFAGKTIFDTVTLPSYQFKEIQAVVKSDTIKVGDPLEISVNAIYKDGRKKLLNDADYTVSSSDTNVIKTIYGKLIAMKEGTATINVRYANFTTSIKVFVNDFKVLDKKLNQEPTKTWTVKFNASVDMASINDKTVYITDKNGQIVKVDYSLKPGSVTDVQLKPIQNYVSGETYTLWIKEVKTRTQVPLKQFTKMDFQIK